MNKLLIVGNWKNEPGYGTQKLACLLHRLEERIKIYREIEVVLAPSMLVLQPLSLQIDRRKFKLAAQNAYYKDQGPYTGEVSFTMLQDLVHYGIVGPFGQASQVWREASVIYAKRWQQLSGMTLVPSCA